MPDATLWLISLPALGGMTSVALALLARASRMRDRGRTALHVLAYALAAGTLFAACVMVASGSGWISPGISGSVPARLLLLTSGAALLCALVFIWLEDMSMESHSRLIPLLGVPPLLWSLLASALLAEGRTTGVLLLMLAALVISGSALAMPPPSSANSDGERSTFWAWGVAGALKHLSLSVLGTVLLVGGVVLLERYPLNLDNRGLLQLGLALIGIGLLVRAGVSPFSAASTDLLAASPTASTLLLGVAMPVVVVVGLLMLAPVEGASARLPWAGGLAGLAALTAGVRALATPHWSRSARGETQQPLSAGTSVESSHSQAILLPVIASACISLAGAWALFGVLSGSRVGAVGAVLISANMGLAVPLLALGARRGGVALLVGGASLLGVPPFGGLAGTLMAAQAAANTSGILLAIFLLATVMVAGGLVAKAGVGREPADANEPANPMPAKMLVAVLIATQVAFFLAAGPVARVLDGWAATVPWLAAP